MLNLELCAYLVCFVNENHIMHIWVICNHRVHIYVACNMAAFMLCMLQLFRTETFCFACYMFLRRSLISVKLLRSGIYAWKVGAWS